MHKKKIILLTGVHPNKFSGKSVTDIKNLFKEKGHKTCIITNVYLREEVEDVISVKSIFKVLKNKIESEVKLLFTAKKEYDKNYYMFSQNSHKMKSKSNLILKNLPFKPDIIIYIFPHYFLNEKDLYEINISTGAPIYRYMADMAEITGGCHYAWDCEGYMKSCGKCPGLYSRNALDVTFDNLKFKKEYVDKCEIYPIAASEWQFQQLLKSIIYNDKKKYKILLPTDEKIFFNQDKIESRKALGLPLDKKIIFFGSVDTTEKRKGAKELLNALNYLNELIPTEKREQIHLAIAGKIDDTFTNQLLFNFTILGYLDYENLSKAYNAANVFVCPSTEDSGPTMISQSLMCGTPVISFMMGVAIDLIENYKTGYIAELGNSLDFAKGIKHILNLNELETEVIKKACIAKAKNKSSNDAFFSNFQIILK